MQENSTRLTLVQAIPTVFHNGTFKVEVLPVFASIRSDSSLRRYTLDLAGPSHDIGTDSVSNQLGQAISGKATTKILLDQTRTGFFGFYIEANLPDFFVAYDGYWASLTIDMSAASDRPAFRSGGWVMSIDVKDVLGGVVSQAAPILGIKPQAVSAAMEVVGQLTGGTKMTIALDANVQDLMVREGAGALFQLTIMGVIMWGRIPGWQRLE